MVFVTFHQLKHYMDWMLIYVLIFKQIPVNHPDFCGLNIFWCKYTFDLYSCFLCRSFLQISWKLCQCMMMNTVCIQLTKHWFCKLNKMTGFWEACLKSSQLWWLTWLAYAFPVRWRSFHVLLIFQLHLSASTWWWKYSGIHRNTPSKIYWKSGDVLRICRKVTWG